MSLDSLLSLQERMLENSLPQTVSSLRQILFGYRTLEIRCMECWVWERPCTMMEKYSLNALFSCTLSKEELAGAQLWNLLDCTLTVSSSLRSFYSWHQDGCILHRCSSESEAPAWSGGIRMQYGLAACSSCTLLIEHATCLELLLSTTNRAFVVLSTSHWRYH